MAVIKSDKLALMQVTNLATSEPFMKLNKEQMDALIAYIKAEAQEAAKESDCESMGTYYEERALREALQED